MNRSRFSRFILLAIGILALALGAIGTVVPLLPTVPFLLLAAACFARSSERLRHWLETHRWFGPTLRHYRRHRAIHPRHRVVSLVTLWLGLGYSAFAVDSLWVRVGLALVGVGVTWHLLRLRTLTPAMLAEDKDPDQVECGTK